MDRQTTRVRNSIQIDGRAETINSVALTVLLKDSNGDVVHCTGLTVPTADSTGFAKGCLFIKTDAADGTKGLYENAGTNTASDFNLIGEITGAEIGDDTVDSDNMTPSMLKYIDVTVTVAEIKALAATNKELVPATEAGAGFAIIPVAASLRFTAGSEVLTESADNLALRYSASTELMVIESTGFIDQATDQNRYQAMAEAVLTPVANTAIDLDNNGDGEIAGNASNDCSLAVRVYYRVVPVL